MSLRDDNASGWGEYEKLVLSELRRHGELLEKIFDKLSSHDTEIAMLKVKASLWGGLTGGLAGIAALIASLLKTHN